MDEDLPLLERFVEFSDDGLAGNSDSPGSGGIRSIMAGVVSRKRHGLASTTKSYAKSAACATSANLRCIMQAN